MHFVITYLWLRGFRRRFHPIFPECCVTLCELKVNWRSDSRFNVTEADVSVNRWRNQAQLMLVWAAK